MQTYQNLNSNSTELSSNLACKKRNIYTMDRKNLFQILKRKGK